MGNKQSKKAPKFTKSPHDRGSLQAASSKEDELKDELQQEQIPLSIVVPACSAVVTTKHEAAQAFSLALDQLYTTSLRDMPQKFSDTSGPKKLSKDMQYQCSTYAQKDEHDADSKKQKAAKLLVLNAPAAQLLDQSTSEPSWTWNNVTGKRIPTFPLERPVDLVQTVPQDVADRISKFLHKRSVVAEYTGSEAQCETSSFLKYSIHLYAKEGARGTTVEIIKNSGCGFEFCTEREAIINAAKGSQVTESNNEPNFRAVLKVPESMNTNYQSREPTIKEHEDLLCRATDKFSSQYSDEQLFVLEHLSSITTPDKLNHQSALQISTLILKNTFDICDLIVKVMDSCMQEESNEIIRRMINTSLVIFSNIMSVVSEEKELAGMMAEHYNYLADLLIPILVRYLKQFETRKCLHTATIALICIRLLLVNSSAAQNYADEETSNIVKKATTVGKSRHFRLEEEAKSTLCALGF